MKKAMISQPMAGKTEEEILAEKAEAEKKLTDLGYEVINTYFKDDWTNKDQMAERGVKNIPLCFLARSLEAMSHVDAVYFCKGWRDARGCQIEKSAAEAYGLGIILSNYR